MKERDFQRAVIQLAEVQGWRAFHNARSDGNLRSHTAAGFPDLVLVRAPEIIFAELKTATGTVTHRQEEWLTALDECAVAAVVWRPADWPEIERRLARRRAA